MKLANYKIDQVTFYYYCGCHVDRINWYFTCPI